MSAAVMSAVFPDAPRAMNALYRDHHGWLQSWLGKKLGNAFDAADLAQDTFERILAAWDKIGETDLREPRAYLTTVASRLLINRYRRLSLERAFLDALAHVPDARAPSPEERLVVLESLREIDARLDRLAPNARHAFLLAQLDGLTHGEIAERLQVHARTIRRYVAQAHDACFAEPSHAASI